MTEKGKEYFEILMEGMNGKFSLVLEGYAAIRKEFKVQVDGIKEEQQLFRSLLQSSHDDLKGDIQGVREELRETKEKLSAKIEAVGDKVNGIDTRDRARGHKVEGHEDRIRFLERKVA